MKENKQISPLEETPKETVSIFDVASDLEETSAQLVRIKDLLTIMFSMYDSAGDTTPWAKMYESVLYSAREMTVEQLDKLKLLSNNLYCLSQQNKTIS